MPAWLRDTEHHCIHHSIKIKHKHWTFNFLFISLVCFHAASVSWWAEHFLQPRSFSLRLHRNVKRANYRCGSINPSTLSDVCVLLPLALKLFECFWRFVCCRERERIHEVSWRPLLLADWLTFPFSAFRPQPDLISLSRSSFSPLLIHFNIAFYLASPLYVNLLYVCTFMCSTRAMQYMLQSDTVNLWWIRRGGCFNLQRGSK